MKSKARTLIEMMKEQLLVNNRVKSKETGASGVIASIAEDGMVTVKWEDGTESVVAPDTLEKVEEPIPVVEPTPVEPTLAEPTPGPEVGAPAEGFRKTKDGKWQMRVIREQWADLPKGWTKESARSFWKSLTGDVKHKTTQCIKRIEGTGITDPGAFCASLRREVEGK